MLPTCIHIGEEPYYGGMHRITNWTIATASHDKPLGGVWTSTLDPMHGTDWLRACEEVLGGAWSWHGNHAQNRTRGNKTHRAWQIVPKHDAKILYIEDEEDYNIVCELYPRPTGNTHTDLEGNVSEILCVDWEAVSKEYDVVYVKKEAQRYMQDWDCETVLFMSTKWECVGIHEFAEGKRERMCDIHG